MKICEIFHSLQGEIDIGTPAIFIRLSGCNLIKMKKSCKWCDSLYAEKNSKEMSISEIMKEVVKYNCHNVVITGGEPLMQQQLFQLLVELNDEGYNISIETNGTIYDHRIFALADKINCSPKSQYLDLKVLRHLNTSLAPRFKFVYEHGKPFWWERIIKELEISNKRVWIMPEGKTKKDQLEKMKEVWEYCVKKNYNFSPRLHVLTYDTKKGV